MYYVYVVQSESTGKIYIGQTKNRDKRIKQHNDINFDKRSYTKLNKGPWKLVYQEQYETRQDALKREKYFKSHHGRDWLRSVLGP